MEYILKNGIVFDPANNIDGEKKDILIKDGYIVSEVSKDAKIIDVTNKLVMPGGVDLHSHIAGPKLSVGRLYRPEDTRRGIKPAPCGAIEGFEAGFSIPTCPTTGYRYTRMGYTTVTEAAVPPLEAKHAHEEINSIPNLDIPTLTLFGNNWFMLKYVKENNLEKLALFISKWLKLAKGYGIKIVNPCGSEAWGWGKNVDGLDDPEPHWGVTGRQVIQALTKVNEKLGLPHSVHVHTNDLGHPGNYETTLETFDCVKDIKKNKNVTRPSELENKRYSLWNGPIESPILKYVVEKDNGDFNKVKLVPNTVFDVVSGLNSDIDAMWIYYNWDGIAAEVKGIETNFFYFKDVDPVLDYYTPVIIANSDYIRENSDIAKGFLRAVSKGYEYCIDNPREAAEILLQEVPELDRDITIKSQEWVSKQYKFDSPKWGYIDSERWNRFYKWLYYNSLITSEISDDFGFTNSYLP